LRYVNTWPKPIQKPHPPIWIPGSTSPETGEWIAENDYLYAHLSLSGHESSKRNIGAFYKVLDRMEKEPNPYRVGMTQVVMVAGSDNEAEELYSEAIDYFYNKSLHVYPGFNSAPGYRSQRALAEGVTARASMLDQRVMTWKDRVDNGSVIAGNPGTVAERLRASCKELGVGHLMMLLQLGNLSHERTMRNIELVATKVLPDLRDLWTEWDDKWWIKPVSEHKRASTARK
jgi:alkanesulfonate monooxygenase SsuD/methylene tetrahydromethanopterin reductase-like flavin-dependent oxidoreductase (luciferase family)